METTHVFLKPESKVIYTITIVPRDNRFTVICLVEDIGTSRRHFINEDEEVPLFTSEKEALKAAYDAFRLEGSTPLDYPKSRVYLKGECCIDEILDPSPSSSATRPWVC